jgi:hypothetical protein
VRNVDTWFFLDGANSLLKQHPADDIQPLSSGMYAVSAGGKLQLTDKNFQPLHEDYLSCLTPFVHGRAVFKQRNKKGLMHANGKVALAPTFLDLIIDGKFLLAYNNFGSRNRWVVLDSAGNTITKKHYDEIAPFNGKYFAVRNGNFWGAVNGSGQEFVACVHDSLIQETSNHIVVKFKGKFGIINLDENWVITPQQNPLTLLDDERYFEHHGKTTFLKTLAGDLVYFSDNLLQFKGDHLLEYLASGAFWMIDLNGIIIDRSYQPDNTDRVYASSEGFRAIYKDGKYGFIDDRGRLRIANRYEDVKPFSNGLAAMRIRGKWGFIDESENIVIQPVYDDVGSFSNGVAIVKQNNVSGVVSTTGKVVLPLRYDEVVKNKHSRFLLKQHGLYGIADSNGTVLINPKFEEVTDTSNGYVIARRNGKYGLLTLQGISTIPMIYDALAYDSINDHFMAVKRAPWEVVKF